jgi:hypothetical protein
MAPKRRTMNKRKSHFKNIKNKSRRVRRGGGESGKEEKEINIIEPINKWRTQIQERADYDKIEDRNKFSSVLGRSLLGFFRTDSNKNKKDNSVNVDTTSEEKIVNNNQVVDDSMNVSSNRNHGRNIQMRRLQNPYLQENRTKRGFRYNDLVPQPALSLINPEKGGRKKRRTMKKEGRKMRK